MCRKTPDQANAIQRDSAAVAAETGGNGTRPDPSSQAVINLDQ